MDTPETVAIAIRNELRAGRWARARSTLDFGIASILQRQADEDANEDQVPIGCLALSRKAIDLLEQDHGLKTIADLRPWMANLQELHKISRHMERNIRLAVAEWDNRPRVNLFSNANTD